MHRLFLGVARGPAKASVLTTGKGAAGYENHSFGSFQIGGLSFLLFCRERKEACEKSGGEELVGRRNHTDICEATEETDLLFF